MPFSIPPLRNVEFRTLTTIVNLRGRSSKAPQNEFAVATVRNPTATRTVQFDHQIRGLALHRHFRFVRPSRRLAMFELTFIRKCNTQSFPVVGDSPSPGSWRNRKIPVPLRAHSLPRLEQKPWQSLSKLVRASTEGTVLRVTGVFSTLCLFPIH
jgi:hypothetical protein